MATARDVVTRALTKRAVLGLGRSPTSKEMTDGITDLNEMLFGWRIDGIDIGHVTVVEADTLDVPDDHLRTITLSLAECLTTYRAPMDPADIVAAEQGRAALRAQYFHIGELQCEQVTDRNGPEI